MKFITLIIVFLVIVGCNEADYYHAEIIGDKKIVTRRSKGDIGSYVIEYQKIKVIRLRMDDDSEYHISYIMNGYAYNDDDLDSFEISVRDGDCDSWIAKKELHNRYTICFPINKIEYFDD